MEKRHFTLWFAAGGTVGSVIVAILVFLIVSRDPTVLNVKITNEIWETYQLKDYQKAIEKAKEFIEEFEHLADELQSELEKNNEPIPSGGKISVDEKKIIFNRGILNDVAICWHIIGRSYERLENKGKAIEAYCNALRYTYALQYDPSWDGFWSSSKDAKEKLKELEGSCKKL